ncbi:I78 family peptidase inhibitor [Shimia sp. W99]
MRPVIPAILCLGALVACAAPDPVPEPEINASAQMSQLPLVGSSSCSEEAFGPMLGRPVSVLETIETPEKVRVIAPGQIITMEYLPQRLNVEHDDRKIVTKVWCG